MPIRFWITLVWVGSIGVIVGCSGKTPPQDAAAIPPVAATPAAGTAPAAATVTPAAGAVTNAGAVPTPAAPQAVDAAHPETKWIGTIPYDVFYDQPLTIASDATPVSGGTSTTPSPEIVKTTPAEGPSGEPASTTPAASSGGKTDWAKVIPLEVALEAVKVARTEINANLVSTQKYNAGMETIQLNAALMGMLAVIVSEHSEEANWKAKAKYIRDLNYEILSKATEKGGGPWKATQELFEQITGMLDGGKPPEKPADDFKPYVETADRADMMKYIDKTMNDLKANIGDPKRMKEQAEPANRQLAVMAALGAMMLDASYEHADNPEYVGFTKAFIEGAQAGVEAVKAEKFEDFQGALNKMNTSCGDCHPKFRGGDGG